MAAKIKKGDKVVILSGKDKGKTGQVTRVIPKEDKVVVSGVNTVKRHQRATQKDAPLHVSNVALVDPKTNEPTRVGFEVRDGKKVRISKKSGEVIDG